jgi:hypothetical protein
MNLVEVWVSIAGPVVLVVEKWVAIVGATGMVVVASTEVLDEVEDEDEDGRAFVLEEECVDEGGGVSVLVLLLLLLLWAGCE